MAITSESKIVIGLVSPIGAGKGTVIAFLQKRGFFCLSLSDRIREEITARGQEITRERLLAVADQIRQDYGSEVLAWRTWQIAQKQKNPKIAIDSIRGLAEVNFFKNQPGFYLIGLRAPQKQRFLWARKRAREGEPLTWEEFVQIDKRDFFSGDGQVGRNIPACLEKADFLIDNNGTIKQLENKVVMILEEIFTDG
jgi:dephospho-CoA kinase